MALEAARAAEGASDGGEVWALEAGDERELSVARALRGAWAVGVGIFGLVCLALWSPTSSGPFHATSEAGWWMVEGARGIAEMALMATGWTAPLLFGALVMWGCGALGSRRALGLLRLAAGCVCLAGALEQVAAPLGWPMARGGGALGAAAGGWSQWWWGEKWWGERWGEWGGAGLLLLAAAGFWAWGFRGVLRGRRQALSEERQALRGERQAPLRARAKPARRRAARGATRGDFVESLGKHGESESASRKSFRKAAAPRERLKERASKVGASKELTLLLEPQPRRSHGVDEQVVAQKAEALSEVLEDFHIKGKIVGARSGPVVTLFEFAPSPGVKSSTVVGLSQDVARSMRASAARISVMSGRNAIGIELPNEERESVSLRDLLESREFRNAKGALPLALGREIDGKAAVRDLAATPHLLVAGTTGSGKSVAINAMILSLVTQLDPSRCRLLLIDPKMLELSVYEGIPHLLAPVVTEAKKAVGALRWAVREMERRYKEMARAGVRNLEGYNERAKRRGEELTPSVVVVVDEMADLMITSGKEVEGALQRLAQMARAAGIHVVAATQRPSVDVITGTIKANFPTRMSFRVTSKIDSRTILGEGGAEALLGSGDMLLMEGGGSMTRMHGPFVSDEEVARVADCLRESGTPSYLEEGELESGDADGGGARARDSEASLGEREELYERAVEAVLRDGRTSTSYLQRVLRIGYNRAAGLVERLESEGVLTAPDASGKRSLAREGLSWEGGG